MKDKDGASVLAIGIDSFDSDLARRLIDEGMLPNLAALADEGSWVSVGSTADIGSGSVWPTFVSGTHPRRHGRYGEWRWHPEEMDVRRFSDEGLDPFWRPLVESGESVGILDVPFAPFLGIRKGFEINEWGAHDVLRGVTRVSPPAAAEIVGRHPAHPFELEPPIPESYFSHEELALVHSCCVGGSHVRGRMACELLDTSQPRLAIIVFPEFHHAAHFLWHSIEPENSLFQDASPHDVPDLTDVCIAIDQEIGCLIERARPGTSIIVFSLHGMRASLGIPNMTSPVLRKHGFAYRATWRTRTWSERRAWAFSSVKGATPPWLKDLYHRQAPLITQIRLARATMQEQHDWSRTSAFALPTDQHGWGRINLTGREGKGIVSTDDYEHFCRRIGDTMSALQSSSGEELVDSVLYTADGDDPRSVRLPDVVIHWADAAFPDDMRPMNPELHAPKVAKSRTGQHTNHAFCIATGEAAGFIHEGIPTEALCKVILRALNETD